MSDKTIRPQEFATAGNYPAGTDDWSGQPRHIILTASEKIDGFAPGNPVMPEVHSGLYQETFEGLSVNAISALKTWARHAPVFTDQKLKFLTAVTLPNHKQKAIVALGDDVSDQDLMLVRSFGSGYFEEPYTDWTPTNAPTCACAGATGEFVCSVNGGGVVDIHPSLGTVVAVSYDFFSDIPVALHYAAFCSRYFVATTTGFIFEGATPGSGSSEFVATSIQAASVGQAGGEFADDGSANIVLACRCVIGGVDRFRIFRSADNGGTWTVTHTAGATVTGLNVVWSALHGCFVALDSLGGIYTSVDGSGFTLLRTCTITSANGASVNHGTLAVQGHCLVKAYNSTVYGCTAAGVVYSFDLGATWRDWTLAEAFTAGDPVRAVLGANGRFYVTTGLVIYTSGCVLAEDHDYV